MHEYICGTTAFQFYRVPPQILETLPAFPDIHYRSGKNELLQYPLSELGVHLPLNVLVTERNQFHRLKSITPRLWSGEVPPGMFCENEMGITLTSPLYTLLTMARYIPETHLLMAMYEFCGNFTVFDPSESMQNALDATRDQHLSGRFGGWEQVRNTSGNPTELWRRPPLIDLDELKHFAKTTTGMRGHKHFLRAAEAVTGVVSSPFEARASIRLALSRRMGGEGFPPFSNNHRIALSEQASRLAKQDTCYADIYFEATDSHGPVDIECHGHAVHDGAAKGGLDANRTLALQNMGIEVVLLTQEQLRNPKRFEATMGHISELLNIERRPKTEAMERRSEQLFQELFVPWVNLGLYSAAGTSRPLT